MSASTRRRTKEDILTIETMGDHQIPIYRVELADGDIYHVPKHVRRIYDENSGLSGWQISFKRIDTGQFSQYFSDQHSPHDSLKRATRGLRRFLIETPATRRSGLRIREDKKKIYNTGIAGVRIYWRLGRRSSIYELKVEARAGAPYSSSTAKNIFVGTEFSATEEAFSRALNEALAFRRQKLSAAVARGETLPKIRGKRPRLTIDMDQAYAVLKKMKERRAADIEQHTRQKVESRLASTRRFSKFRNRPISWAVQDINGIKVKVPDFISKEGNEWLYEYRLPNGDLFGGSLEVSSEPAEDIKEIIIECFTDSVMATVEPPKERLYEPSPRYSSMPLAVIQAMNERAKAS